MMVQMTRNAGYDEARATSLTRHRSLDVEGGELSEGVSDQNNRVIMSLQACRGAEDFHRPT